MTAAPASRAGDSLPRVGAEEGCRGDLHDHECEHRSGGESERDAEQRVRGAHGEKRSGGADRLRRTRGDRCPERSGRADPGLLHRNGCGGAFRHVLQGDCQKHEQPQPSRAAGPGRPQCKTFGEAVDEEDAEYQQSAEFALATAGPDA